MPTGACWIPSEWLCIVMRDCQTFTSNKKYATLMSYAVRSFLPSLITTLKHVAFSFSSLK